jgi:hypothetical protein
MFLKDDNRTSENGVIYVAKFKDKQQKLSIQLNTKKLRTTRYEGESVNRSQMDIKHVICEPGETFLNVSSTNIDALIPSPYQCVKTRSIEVFGLLSQPLLHLCFNLFCETVATFLDPVVNCFA